MANRIKLKGTTEESFDIAIDTVSGKVMTGITLEADNPSGLPELSIKSSLTSLETSLHINPSGNGAWLKLGNQSSSLQASDGVFSYTTGSSSTGDGNVLTLAAGTGVGSNKDGGDLIIVAGNASGGSGSDGNVTISSGSATNVGDLTIEANNWNATLIGELNINTDPGTSGEVLTSQGAGSPPIWSAPAAAAPNYEAFVATASQTVFNTTMGTVAASAGKAYLQVFVNGVQQQEGASFRYTVTGANQITFTGGLASGDNVTIFGF